MFIDYTKVKLTAGNGGDGITSFRREKYVPKGGPDGGDGGRGGHIVFKANRNLHTLQDVRYKKNYKAESGKRGSGSRKNGRNGSDVIIPLPVGSIVKKENDDQILSDLTKDGQTYIACRGGIGGRGNAKFATSTNRAPQTSSSGKLGETGEFEIELKILADVGLVGLPNAGKSTLLSKISSARPKVAEYPFTTLEPHLGIVKYEEYKSFVMADIPGLIKGASYGRGLGYRFLKHIERNKVLLFMIDCSDESPGSTLDTLKKEIISFNKDLVLKPMILCRTKMDIYNEKMEKFWTSIDRDIISISSVNGEGIKELISLISKVLNEDAIV